MANDNTNGSDQAAAKTPAVKAPMVKRIKIPTVRPGAPAAKPAAQTSAPSQADPAARVEAQHTENKEPDLPPEDKKKVAASAVEAEDIEKLAPPKKIRRGPAVGEKETAPEEKKENIQLTKLKVLLKKMLMNKWCRLGIILSLIAIICAGVYSSLPVIAEKKLPVLFAENGMPFKRFKMKTLTIDSMELTNVSDQTGTLTISSIKFDYSLLSLFLGNSINSMTLSGVTATGEKRNDGISLGVLNNLIYSPINAKKGKELTIRSLKISNGTFVLKNDAPPEQRTNENGEVEEIDNTIYVNFNADGSLGSAGLNMTISTDYTSPNLQLKTQTALNKTTVSSQIKTEITLGEMKKNDEKIGSVTGNMEVTVNNGVLSTGTAVLQLLSSSQKLDLKTEITPKASGFDFTLDLERSFDNPKDAAGKFVGALSMKANDFKVNGTFDQFEIRLPLQVKSPALTNGRTSVQNLEADTDMKISCKKSDCSASLLKPTKLSFSGLKTDFILKQLTFFKPLELSINPDPTDPLVKLENNILSFTLPVGAFSTQLFATDQVTNAQMSIAMNGLKSRIKYNPFSGAFTGDAVFQQSGYADKDIQMTGVQGIVVFRNNALPEARLRVAKAVLTKPDILPELSGDVRFRPTGSELGMESVIQIQNGLVSVNLSGSYSPVTHEWNLSLLVPKTLLSETGVKLSTVMPFMAKYLPDTTSGAFAVKGRVLVKDNTVVGPLDIVLENIHTSWKDIDLESVNGVLRLTSLSPLGTPENQQLFIGILNSGIPFQNVLTSFQIQPKKGLDVTNVRFTYADAQFKTLKSFNIPYEGQPSQILLEGSGLNLSMLEKNLKSPALRMDGIMNSEWRISLTDDMTLKIDQAVFQTKIPGTLHYTAPESLRAKMNPQMLEYMKDVIVKKMKITAKGMMNGQISFDVFINGHSPLETEQDNQDVSFDFKSTFKSLLKQEGQPVEIPTEVMMSLQNFSK